MTMRTVLLDDKVHLFELLSSGDISGATDYFLTCNNPYIRSDAGFIALSANKPEFIDVIFDNIDIFDKSYPHELLKQVTFASCVRHYEAIAKATYPDVTTTNNSYLDDIFTQVIYKDDALFLNWLLDNGFKPAANYDAEDSSRNYSLLDVSAHLRSYKCTSILIERGFETHHPTRLKDMAWAYPHSEANLNNAAFWKSMFKLGSKAGSPKRLAEWIDKMTKSDRNVQFALTALLNIHCNNEDAIFEGDEFLYVTNASERIKGYLKALENRAFSSLDRDEVIISLFFNFNKPEVTTQWDINHALKHLKSPSLFSDLPHTGIDFNACSNKRYVAGLICQAGIYNTLINLSEVSFTSLDEELTNLLRHLDAELRVDDDMMILPDKAIDPFMEIVLPDDDSEEHY